MQQTKQMLWQPQTPTSPRLLNSAANETTTKYECKFAAKKMAKHITLLIRTTTTPDQSGQGKMRAQEQF